MQIRMPQAAVKTSDWSLSNQPCRMHPNALNGYPRLQDPQPRSQKCQVPKHTLVRLTSPNLPSAALCDTRMACCYFGVSSEVHAATTEQTTLQNHTPSLHAGWASAPKHPIPVRHETSYQRTIFCSCLAFFAQRQLFLTLTQHPQIYNSCRQNHRCSIQNQPMQFPPSQVPCKS